MSPSSSRLTATLAVAMDSYRGAAAISGTTPKTVKRVIARHESGSPPPARAPGGHNYDAVTELVAERVEKSKGRITVKRILPVGSRTWPRHMTRGFMPRVRTG